MLLKKKLYGAILLVALTMLSACSTQKNTWLSRFYHTTTTRYNVHFNGAESYDKGIKQLEESNQDNFSNILPLYPISNPDNQQTASSAMTQAIEKCRKSIKLH